ncbi:MAG: endonuclease domain-containing protein [Cyclobacteriaceae bacterium]
MLRKPSRGHINNRPELEGHRKYLRNFSTSAEAALWILLKGKQLAGRKFRRQHSVGNYILDFYCPSEKLAVELDGEHHFTEEGIKYDEKRASYINQLDIRIVRFENSEVFTHPEAVLAKIKSYFKVP